MTNERDMDTMNERDMEWKEVPPKDDDWLKQINIIAFCGNYKVGSIAYCGPDFGWVYEFNENVESMMATTEKEAKEEMIEILKEYFENEIGYYKILIKSLDGLR